VAIVIVVTLAGMLLLTKRRPGFAPNGTLGNSAGRQPPESDRLYIENLDYKIYDGADLIGRLRARELVHRRRKIGSLTINPVKEVELNGVRFEILPRRERERVSAGLVPDDTGLQTLLEGALASKNLGFVSRIVLRDFEVDDRRAGEAGVHLRAGLAECRPGRGPIRLADKVEWRAAGRLLLKTDDADWDPEARRLVVRGSYEAQEGTAAHQGRDATFRIEAGGLLVRER
jgi:hypothetical protein